MSVTVEEVVQSITVNETTQVITISLGTTGGTTDHTTLSNIGTNTHAQIDSHIADSTIHFTEGSIDHTAISNIGTNTHAQIDTHIASTSNPHSVDIDDVTPTTTKGDILVENGTNVVRLAIGTNDQVLTADSTQAAGVKWADASGGSSQLTAYIKDVKASNTDGGGFTAGDDGGVFGYQRDLNTLSGNTTFISLTSNRFTLDAGTYKIRAEAPAFKVNAHQAILYNYSDTSVEIYGGNAYSGASDACITNAVVIGEFTIASSKTFEIRHKSQSTKATNGMGPKLVFDSEVYTQVEITKIA